MSNRELPAKLNSLYGAQILNVGVISLMEFSMIKKSCFHFVKVVVLYIAINCTVTSRRIGFGEERGCPG